MAATLATCPTCTRQVSTAARSCPHCGQPLSVPNKRAETFVFIAIIGIVMVLLVANALRRPSARDATEDATQRFRDPNAYSNLTEPERTSCDAYATAAENFARGREAGLSLETHLTAAAVACRNNPTSATACKGFPKLAAAVHAGKWTVAEAASKVKADCRHYIWP